MNKQASTAEMRAYVCGQCHVEYYFKGPEKRLVYPWSKGLKIEEITAYYDEIGFATGPTRIPVLPRSRHSIPSSRRGTRARMRARVSPAPIATCRRFPLRSPITGCAARC